MRPAKYVNHVNINWYVRQLTIDRLAEDLVDLRIVNGHWNDFEARVLHIPRDIERGLISLRLGLDSEDSDNLRLGEQAGDAVCGSD